MKAEFPPHSNVCATCFTISKLIQEAYFSWYMPQAIMGSQIIGQRCYLDCAYLTQTLLNALWIKTHFLSSSGVTSQVTACILLGLSFKQPSKICHRFQHIVCLISPCWHFSSIKMSERHVLLKAQVVVF